MEKPNMDQVRDLLKTKDFDAIVKIESQIMDWCEHRIKTNYDKGFSIQSLFLNTIEDLERKKEKDSQDPLPDYCLGLVFRLMDKYQIVRIDDYQDIRVGDATYYCWKHKGKTYLNPVDVVEVYENRKVKIRYTHHHNLHDGFEHTFQAKNFKFAIRQLTTPKKENLNTRYTFFFFNS